MKIEICEMDDSFRVRVEKIFGSLERNEEYGWSVSDKAVEKREWSREEKSGVSGRDETPCSSSFDGFLSRKDRRKLRFEVDDDDEDGDRDMDGEEWVIRASIGLDNTLDNEEEEDEFDKVASGRENAGERLYMNDVNEHHSYLNLRNVVPNSFKDPRANLYAAKIRLKEDDIEAQNAEVKQVKESPAMVPKPILKRKDDSTESNKPKKRVRFDKDCKIDSGGASEMMKDSNGSSPTDAISSESDDGLEIGEMTYRVPDYVLNPCRYTHYSFDSSSEGSNEGSNTKACMDLLELIKLSKSKVNELSQESENRSGDLQRSVTFIPKKKSSLTQGDARIEEDDGKQSVPRAAALPVGVAAGESHEPEVTVNEDTEPETETETNDADSFHAQKARRRYRTQSRSDDSDP